MAKNVKNDVVEGISGLVGKIFCYRQLYGKTVVCHRPAKRPGSGTPNQAKAREQMRGANIYAKGVINDPSAKAAYELYAKDGVKAYHLAVKDYCKAPVVTSLSYSGTANELIYITAEDDFEVVTVTIRILNEAGEVIEEGEAESIKSKNRWAYRVQSVNHAFEGVRIIAIAKDRPGNKGTMEIFV